MDQYEEYKEFFWNIFHVGEYNCTLLILTAIQYSYLSTAGSIDLTVYNITGGFFISSTFCDSRNIIIQVS
jgi:hypothetical protein